MASNPNAQSPSSGSAVTADRVVEIVGTVTAVVGEIEKLMGGSGVPQIQQLTALFGNLAGVAIQAVHEVTGKAVTPESVLALMPAATSLVEPSVGTPRS